jgi:hypothetical protein
MCDATLAIGEQQGITDLSGKRPPARELRVGPSRKHVNDLSDQNRVTRVNWAKYCDRKLSRAGFRVAM